MDGIRRRKKKSDAVSSQRKAKPSFPQNKKRTRPIRAQQHDQFSKQRKPRKKRVLRKFIHKYRSLFRFMLRMLVVFALLFFVLNQSSYATLVLRPHFEYRMVDIQTTAELNPSSDTLGLDIMALSDEVSLPIVAQAKHFVEHYARGSISIINNYSSEPQRLLAHTRFTSAGGDVFLLEDEEIIVPGKTEEGPGIIEAKVRAEKPGEAYNIAVTDFRLPGFIEAGLEEKYNKLYAVSHNSFSGGFSGTEAYISKEQKKQATNELRKMLKRRLELRLVKEKTDQVLLVKKSAEIYAEEPEFISDGEAGVLSMRGMIRSLVIGTSEIRQYLNNYYRTLDTRFDADIVSFAPLELSYAAKNTTRFDYEKGSNAIIDVSGKLLFRSTIDTKSLAEELRHTKKNALQDTFENIPSIDKAQFDLRPFWKRYVPDTFSADDITIKKQNM